MAIPSPYPYLAHTPSSPPGGRLLIDLSPDPVVPHTNTLLPADLLALDESATSGMVSRAQQRLSL